MRRTTTKRKLGAHNMYTNTCDCTMRCVHKFNFRSVGFWTIISSFYWMLNDILMLKGHRTLETLDKRLNKWTNSTAVTHALHKNYAHFRNSNTVFNYSVHSKLFLSVMFWLLSFRVFLFFIIQRWPGTSYGRITLKFWLSLFSDCLQ